MDLHIGCSGGTTGTGRVLSIPRASSRKNGSLSTRANSTPSSLNVTFYGQPAKATFERWYATVPDRFFFSVKMSRFITHTMRLEVRPESIMRFSEGVSLLADKLGIVLIQPPSHSSFRRRCYEEVLLPPRPDVPIYGRGQARELRGRAVL